MLRRTVGVGCLMIAVWAGVIAASAAREPVVNAPVRPAEVRLASARLPVGSHELAQSARPAPVASHVTSARALLEQHCVPCHNAKLKTAGLVLDNMNLEQVGAGAEVWEKVRRKLRAGAMPPAGRSRPDPSAQEAFLTWLETEVDRAAAATPNPGRKPALHRLNRLEYTNAVRDLLALEIDGRALLPADDSGYGFDNIADVLSVSPGLLERYVMAANKISRWAIGDPSLRPGVTTYRQPYMRLTQDDRMSEDLPFGSRGGMAIRHFFPLDAEYTIKIHLQRNMLQIGSEIRGLDVENLIDVRVDGRRVKQFKLEPRSYHDGTFPDHADTDDEGLEVRFPVRAGTRVVGVTFQRDAWYVEGVGMSRLPPGSDGYASGRVTEQTFGKIEAEVNSVDIVGPFEGTVPVESPSRRQIFVCSPASAAEEEPCARRILTVLARRAYRRPVTEEDLQPLLGLYQEGRRAGSFDRGIQAALPGILSGPDFLFRIERDPANVAPGAVYRVNDIELASRLSFFLWSSIPDDQLLDVATRSKLSDPAVLEQQVRRMLGDARARALPSTFFGQWLWVRNMGAAAPDLGTFPEFDENLRTDFQQETELFLESQLREDRGALELLTANYTFLNERLARHYGVPNVYGSQFRRVTFTDDRRAGLLGQGSVLTVTSYANRTSPVVRGKWLLTNLLGTPPSPPPANVPPFPENEVTTLPKSVRERMEEHRKNPVCAACHARMDPLGFAFENFDAVGKWRTADAGAPIDPSGAFPDGAKFGGPLEFRMALLHHENEFVETLTEKLLTYALGRGIEYFDMPAVRGILREAAAHNYRWSSLIVTIAKSMPFQMRRAES